MTKKKIIIVSIIALLVLATASVFAPVSVDKFLWGDKFENYVINKYSSEFDYQISKENVGWGTDKDKISYYFQSEEGLGLNIINEDIDIFNGKTEMIKSVSYNGRNIYISVFFKYNNEIHEIEFEGTRWFYGKYSWKMLDNEFFPIKDENFINTPDVVHKTP